MNRRTTLPAVLMGSLALLSLAGLGGCSSARRAPGPQGVTSGVTSTALAAALVAPTTQGAGASLSTGPGPGSGWLVAADPAKLGAKNADVSRTAEEQSRNTPATIDDVRKSDTADLNGDGFVSLDEVVALRKAGLSDREMIDRLQRTRQVFQLSARQQDYLRDRGVSQPVIDAMVSMSRGNGGSVAGG